MLTYQNVWIFLAPLLSGLTATSKLVRVKILVSLLLVNEYADLIFLMFIHGFIVSFEPSQLKIYVKHLVQNKALFITAKKLNTTFFYIATFTGIIILMIAAQYQKEGNSYSIISILLLTIANYLYSKFIFYLAILESNGQIHVNRIIKLFAELTLLTTCLALHQNLSANIVLSLYVMTLILSLLIAQILAKRQIVENKMDVQSSLSLDVKNEFWCQIKIQTVITAAFFIPVLLLQLETDKTLLAFYFIFAQLMQIGNLILLPIMNVLFPELSKSYANNDKFINVSLLSIIAISAIYFLISMNISQIISIWLDGNFKVHSHIIRFLAILSLLELCHIAIRYLYTATYSAELLLKHYLKNSILCILPTLIIAMLIGLKFAVMLYPIWYLLSVIITIFRVANLKFGWRELMFTAYIVIYITLLYGVSGN